MKNLLPTLITCLLLTSCNQATTYSETDKTHDNPAIMLTDPDHRMKDLHWTRDMFELICQNWENAEDVKDAERNKHSERLEFPYRGFCFFKDGTVIKNPRGNMQTGTWTIDSSSKPVKIKMQLSDEGTASLLLAYLTPYELKLADEEIKKQLVEYSATAAVYQNEEENPFHIKNIRWRFKPARSENAAAIKNRLKDCIRFFILFYDDHIYRHTETVSFYGLPSCFRWYAGGIFLQKKLLLDKNWINSFYNLSQAMDAYKIAEKLLAQKYTWPKGETNWMKQNVYVLKQMEQNLDSL
ncbi:MAG: hypothetical protein ABIY51_13945 [Ferruginibacter sp.]